MTKRKSKATKSTVKATAAKGAVKKSSTAPATTATPPLIVLGYDDQQKPRGARFDQDKPDLVTKAAELIGLKVYDTSNPDVAAIAKKLPVGRLYANGHYSQLVVALAGKPEAALSPDDPKDSLPAARGLPRTWDEVAPGHLVVAHESFEDGWWEAIVIDRKDDRFTLRYRDFPKLPKFFRHRSCIALIYPPDEERRPEASA
jgi:hypothetical protein